MSLSGAVICAVHEIDGKHVTRVIFLGPSEFSFFGQMRPTLTDKYNQGEISRATDL